MLATLYLGALLILHFGHDAEPTSAMRLRSSSSKTKHGGPERLSVGKEVGNWTFRQLKDPAEHFSERAINTVSSERVSSDVGECILLFGAFCNGNMGDAMQPMAMEHLLASVAPNQCFWYAHPWVEESGHGSGIGEFFSDHGDTSRLINLTPYHAEKVNGFKALIIGGGGIFAAKHAPLDVSAFTESLTLPVVIMGVGAGSYRAKNYATLIEKAVFVSGRDATSINAFSSLLRKSKDPVVQPEDVALVRDPVLSDKILTDTKGTCWKQSEGEDEQPLCFVLPASNTKPTVAMHKHLVANVVKPGDVFVNVFPKHQGEILAQHDYPGEVVPILDAAEFKERMCSCRAIVSARLHGVVLGLHMGVPTLGASGTSYENNVAEVMIDTLRLPEQYLVINERLTREVVDQKVDVVRKLYTNHGRRSSIQARLSTLHDEFEAHAQHVLFDILGTKEQVNTKKQKKHEEEDFFSDADIAGFLPTASAKAGAPISGRSFVSSALPSTAAKDIARDRNTKKEREEKKRATSAIVQEPGPVVDRVGGNAAEHPATEMSPMSSKLSTSPTSAVVRHSSTAKIERDATATATASTTTTPSQHAEKPVRATDKVRQRAPLADALLAHNVISRQFVEEQPAPAIEPKSETHLVKADGLSAPIAKIQPAAPEALMLNGRNFKQGVTAEAQGEKREDGQPATAINNDRYHRSDVPQKTERITKSSETPVPEMVSATGTKVPAGERAPINNDYLAALLLLVTVVGLSLLPSEGTVRKAHGDLVVKDATLGDGGDTGSRVQNDGESLTRSDPERNIPSTPSVGAFAGVAATSPKVLCVLNFIMWVSLAIGFSEYGKAYLRDTHDAVGLLVLQGATGVLVLCWLGRFGMLNLHPGKDLTQSAAHQAGWAALLHTGQALLTNFAVLMGGVAMTNALKAMEPVAAAVFSYFFLGQTCSGPRMAAILTIVVGITLLTPKSIKNGSSHDYSLVWVHAMAAVCFNALRNVVIKKGNPIPPQHTLFACSAVATIVGVGLMLLKSGFLVMGILVAEEYGSVNSGRRADASWLRMSGVNAALCFVGYNFASFNLLARLSPVGHAVGNSCKRMLVFASGLLFLGDVMTLRQLGGTAVALFGVLVYNTAGTW